MTRLAGKRIVLTGAAGALGSAIAEACVREGAAGLVLADLDLEAAQTIVERLGSDTTRVLAVAADVGQKESVDDMVRSALNELGGVEVLINNAGILTPSARVHNVTEDDFNAIMNINVMGAFRGMHAVIPWMRANGGGSIINTASVAGLTAWSHTSPYCTTKAALIHLSKVAAIEYAAEGIRVNSVCPGTFFTKIHEGLPQEALDDIAGRHPLGRVATVEEVASAFVYLASDESSFVTGTSLVVDGGYSAP